jgi:single-stranded-DNA-specific exonuclease
MASWSEPPDIFIPDELAAVVGGHHLVAQALVRRGMLNATSARAFLDPDAYTPSPPEELPGMLEAVERLEKAIDEGEKILVWGDFDVDGQTSTALLVSSLRQLGANVSFHIPVRADESHGVNLPVLSQLLNQPPPEKPRLLLTCDTGISAREETIYAQNMGVEVIITDHHDLLPTLPAARAVINPKLLPENHPLATLPGVGVAYKLAESLYARAGRIDEVHKQLDLVALGIIADLALLRDDTRYLAQRGLEQLRNTQRRGLQAIMEYAELDARWLTEEHISFVIAPRLNALGRLSNANPAVELLTTEDMGRARLLALQLEGLNARRKLLTDQVYQAAQAQMDQDPSLEKMAVLVLAHPTWPAGVLGIVASRMVESYHKPVILLANPEGELARGSARSIEGVNINAAIASQKDLLAGFGGHPMAAGLSLEAQNIPDFHRALNREVEAQLGEIPAKPPLQIDAYLPLADLNLDLVADMERLAPFGPGNPAFTLASRGLRLVSQSSIGREGEHLLLRVEDEQGIVQPVVWWQGGGEQAPEGKFDLAYTVRASNYRGQREVQVEWVEARLIKESMVEMAGWRAPAEILDYRQEIQSLPILESLRGQPGVQVWSEAGEKERIGGLNRLELKPGPILVVWTIPPRQAQLKAALLAVEPEKVVLFAVDPGMDTPDAFIKRLAGLVKFAMNSNQGLVRCSRLAAATAQSESAVLTGLKWLAANGSIQFDAQEADSVWLSAGGGQKEGSLQPLGERLKSILEETAAYRQYYMRANQDALLRIS